MSNLLHRKTLSWKHQRQNVKSIEPKQPQIWDLRNMITGETSHFEQKVEFQGPREDPAVTQHLVLSRARVQFPAPGGCLQPSVTLVPGVQRPPPASAGTRHTCRVTQPSRGKTKFLRVNSQPRSTVISQPQTETFAETAWTPRESVLLEQTIPERRDDRAAGSSPQLQQLPHSQVLSHLYKRSQPVFPL